MSPVEDLQVHADHRSLIGEPSRVQVGPGSGHDGNRTGDTTEGSEGFDRTVAPVVTEDVGLSLRTAGQLDPPVVAVAKPPAHVPGQSLRV